MKTQATAKFVGTSNRKVGLVAALIRGRSADEALTVLRFTPKRAADPVGKVLASAIANATNNHGAKQRDLVIDQVLVGAGPTLKRFRPRSRGMAAPVRHRSSHITVVLRDSQPEVVAKAKPATTKAAASRTTKKEAK